MLIGIDGNEANEVRADIGERVGANVYAYELFWEFYRLRKNGKTNHNFIIYLKNKPSTDLPKEKPWWRYQVISGGGLWIIKKLTPYLLKKDKPDVFFSPNHYLPPFTLMPKICTIHDLGYLKFSGQFKKSDFWQLKYWTAISITISKHIISVSKSTKRNIVRHYPLASKKCTVIYHGYDNKRFNVNIRGIVVRRVKKKYNIRGDYILFISTLKPSKNIEGIIDAFYLLLKNKDIGNSLSLVIGGNKGWLYDSIFKKVRKLKLGRKVVFTGYVSEKDKPALLKGAKILISPSFWEGFGLHLIESLACGTPLVASNVASIPEVVGDAAVYVNPTSAEDISTGLTKVLTMSKVEYNKLVKKGLKQVLKYSWGKSASQTIKVLEKSVR